jgi:hypothetical protein
VHLLSPYPGVRAQKNVRLRPANLPARLRRAPNG